MINSSHIASSRIRGTLVVYACSSSLTAPVGWVVNEALRLGDAPELSQIDWRQQNLMQGFVRTEVRWNGERGIAARIASGLRSVPNIRFDVYEQPTEHELGERFSFVPELGLHRAQVNSLGEILISENVLRQLSLRQTVDVDALIGSAWDDALEAFRIADSTDAVRYAHRVS